MAMVQCPKCLAWMDEDSTCPFCGSTYSASKREMHHQTLLQNIEKLPEPIQKLAAPIVELIDDTAAQPSSPSQQPANDGSQYFCSNDLNGSDNRIDSLLPSGIKKSPIRIKIFKFILVYIIVSFVIFGIILVFVFRPQAQKRNALPTLEECATKYEYLEDRECWWSADYWSDGIPKSLKKFEKGWYKSKRQNCLRWNRCPRPDKILPVWQRWNHCQVKAAARYRKEYTHYAESGIDEEIILYVENHGNENHEVWLKIGTVESRPGYFEKGGFVKDSYVVYGIDMNTPATERVTQPDKVQLGGESFYNDLKEGKRLNVIFAVPNSHTKSRSTQVILAYRVFSLDNMAEVCDANAGRIGE